MGLVLVLGTALCPLLGHQIANANSAHAQSASARTCKSVGTTVLANSRVRIYTRPYGDGGYRAIACVLRTGVSRALGVADPTTGGVSGFRLAQYHVAYESRACSRTSGSCRSQIRVKNIRTGKVAGSAVAIGVISIAYDIEVANSGSVIWSRQTETSAEVRKLDAGGEAVLATGDDIDSRSLAISGSTAYWTKAGQPFSAQLVGSPIAP